MAQNVFNLVLAFFCFGGFFILLHYSNRIIEFNCLCWKIKYIHRANDDNIELPQPEVLVRSIFHGFFLTVCGLV